MVTFDELISEKIKEKTENLSRRIDNLNKKLSTIDIGGAKLPPKLDMAVNLSDISAHTTSWPFANVIRQMKYKDSMEQGRTLYDQRNYPEGTYTAVWEGKGRLSFTEWGGNVKSQSLVGPNMIQIEVEIKNHKGIRLDVMESDPDDPVRNVRLWVPGVDVRQREDRYLSTGFGGFSPDFVERLAPFKAIRLMDWMKTNNSPIEKWTDRNTLKSNSWHDSDVPAEVMAELANDCGVDIWLCMPHKANNDFIEKYAQTIKEKIQPDKKIYVEFSNECWNWAFDQADWCKNKGGGGTTGRDKYYAKRSAEVFDIWRSVFHNDQPRFVLSAQSANPSVAERILSVREAAHSADVLAVAPYFKAWNLEPDSTVEDVLDAADSFLDRAEYTEELVKHASLARRDGLKFFAYEGGPGFLAKKGLNHMEFTSDEENKLTDTMIKANRHPRMYKLMIKAFRIWKNSDGQMFACYSFCDRWSWSGMWGFLEWLTQPIKDAPKYKAIVDTSNKEI